MQLATRRLLDRSFSVLCLLSIVFMSLALLVILVPIFSRGIGAFFFFETVEHRAMLNKIDKFERGNTERVDRQIARAKAARKPIYDAIAKFKKSELPPLEDSDPGRYYKLEEQLEDLEEELHQLLGPGPDAENVVLPRNKFGELRWDRSKIVYEDVVYITEWVLDPKTNMNVETLVPRKDMFKDTSLYAMFEKRLPLPDSPDFDDYKDLRAMMMPQFTFYWRFLTDESIDNHMLGGIWPELLGTFYLTVLAMVFAIPIGVIAAIYLVEYAREGMIVSLLRTCISTLAGVPSIVFGLFGLAFFLNSIGWVLNHPSEKGYLPLGLLKGGWFEGTFLDGVLGNKCVLAGSLTLSLLILPTIIRAAEEAIRAVPLSYKEAAMGLGASRWRTVVTVILPAAAPGILTGIVISMGRAAGETAPIIFTAAVSMGQPIGLTEVFYQPSPALPWNIYNLCTEHDAAEEIQHMQWGMVLTLVTLVLALNFAAIYLRARISKKLRG